jgi:hypothetical protein
MNIDFLNKWLSAGASISVIVGVIAAIVSVIVAGKTLKQTQGAASATLSLKLLETLEADRYKKLRDEIQMNNSSHALRKIEEVSFKIQI